MTIIRSRKKKQTQPNPTQTQPTPTPTPPQTPTIPSNTDDSDASDNQVEKKGTILDLSFEKTSGSEFEASFLNDSDIEKSAPKIRTTEIQKLIKEAKTDVSTVVENMQTEEVRFFLT
jgi:hypothetical protein